jgi:hypothetical protein
MFVPISQERLLRLRIGEIEKRVANAKEALRIIKVGGAAVDPASAQNLADAVAAHDRLIADLRKALNDLSAADRSKPAYVTDPVDEEHPLAAPGAPGIRAVVAANPAFFDQSRPSDFQVLSVFEGCVHDECVHHDLVEKLIAQLDWKALAAIVR